jgi:hypothetical protein
MWPVMPDSGIGACQADAVFASGLQRGDEPSAGQVRQAVAAAICAFGYFGCIERVAQEFGDHPETAVIRMRWARGVVREAFADSVPEPGPRPNAGATAGSRRWLCGDAERGTGSLKCFP